MESFPDGGLRQMKESIWIDAPVERCYQEWTNQLAFPTFMKRIIALQIGEQAANITQAQIARSPSQPSASRATSGLTHYWTFVGPNNKLYNIESKVITDIPNTFYSTSSTDINDVCTQVSVLFSSDAANLRTFMEIECSFWESPTIPQGKSTRLLSDIYHTDDSLLRDCLQDFKHHVETLPAPPA